MKNYIKAILLFVSFMVMVSCGSSKPPMAENTQIKTVSVTETVHDTVFKIEKDSSFYRALLECQNGKIVIKNVSKAEPGRTLKSPKVRIANNVLQIDCEARAQELFAKWKSTYTKENKQEVKRVPIITNVLTWWQQTQIRGFWLLLILFFGRGIWGIIKNKYKTLIG